MFEIAGVCVLLVVASPDVDRAVDEALADDENAPFCHDDDYPLTDEEAVWCSDVERLMLRCPKLESACDAPRAVTQGMQGRLSSRSAEESSGKSGERGSGTAEKPERTPAPPIRPERQAPSGLELPTLGPIAELFFWLIIAIGVGLLVYAVSRFLKQERVPEIPEEPEPMDSSTPVAAPVVPLEAGHAPTLAEAAERAARAGDWETAIRLGHRAALSSLHDRELIRLHRSKTHGDYLRQLRAHPPMVRPARSLMACVDGIEFGRQPADESGWRRVSDAMRVLLGTALVLVLAGCARSYPYPTSPSGTRVLERVMVARGSTIDYRQEAFEHLGTSGVGTIVLLRDAVPTEEEWVHLRSWVFDGNQLIVANGAGVPEAAVIEGGGPVRAIEGRFQSISIPGTSRIEAPSRPLILFGVDGDAYAIQEDWGDGRIVVIADDHLFTNIGMLPEGNAAEAVALLEDYYGAVELVDAFFWSGADSPMDIATDPRITPVVLQLLLLVFAILLWRGAHFGRPRADRQATRRAFSEHTEALGAMYERAGASDHALQVYARYAIERLAERMSGSVGDLEPLAKGIAARTGRDERKVLTVLRRAAWAANGNAPEREQAMETLAQLSGIVRQVTGKRR